MTLGSATAMLASATAMEEAYWTRWNIGHWPLIEDWARGDWAGGDWAIIGREEIEAQQSRRKSQA